MYSRNSFGSYYPIKSIIHRLNPVVKLIIFVLILFLLIFSSSLYIHIFLISLITIMILLSKVPLSYYFKTIWFFRYIYILMAFILAYFSISLELTVVYILKLIIFVEYINIFAFTTSPSETIYGIEKIISPFNFLFLPISKIAFKINNALRYLPLIMSVEYRVLKAQSSRGIDYNNSNIFGRIYALNNILSNIFSLTKEKNNEIKFSEKLRLYNVKTYRTNYRTNKVGLYDVIFMLFILLMIYAYIKEKGIL